HSQPCKSAGQASSNCSIRPRLFADHSRSAKAILLKYEFCRSRPRDALSPLFACQTSTVLAANPATARKTAQATTVAVVRATLFRLANLRKRYIAEAGHACTGSSLKYRFTSAAKLLAVS